jgi:hypothetical protein
MTSSQHLPSSVPVEQDRDRAIDALSEHFAGDRLTVAEFERRVDMAHRARSYDELRSLLADLPGPSDALAPQRHSVPAKGSSYSVASEASVKDHGTVIAVMGGTGRKGRWAPARRNLVLAVMGGAELDFREAMLPPGVTEVTVYTMWGGVDIVVPPDLHVESNGFAVMGGFEFGAEEQAPPPPGAPSLRISGVAVMGAVDITVRRPGETARDARRRRRLERRERRRLESGER